MKSRVNSWVLVALVMFSGCNMVWRKVIADPERDQVIRVESGERLYFDLEENMTTGYRWEFICTDPDIEVTLVHHAAKPEENVVGAPGEAEVRIRVHRGYDGPTDVRFRYRRPWEEKPIKEFVISLYRRTGDCAFWE